MSRSASSDSEGDRARGVQAPGSVHDHPPDEPPPIRKAPGPGGLHGPGHPPPAPAPEGSSGPVEPPPKSKAPGPGGLHGPDQPPPAPAPEGSSGPVEPPSKSKVAEAGRSDLDEKGRSALHQAALKGDAAEVQRLLEAGEDMELEDEEGNRPLHLAGSAEVVDLLLAAKASLEAENTGGSKPIHHAAEEGHLDVVDRLLQANADVNDGRRDGVRPLHLAAHNGHLSVVDRLLEAKAEVEAEDKDGGRPLHLAAANGHSDAVERLLSAKADLEAQDKNGARPLHVAALGGRLEIVKQLLAADANGEAQDNNGQTPYDLAKKTKEKGEREKEMMALLRSAAGRLDLHEEGRSALHRAALEGDVAEVQRLLEAGEDMEFEDEDGSKPIHHAAAKGHLDVVGRLLQANDDVNDQRSRDGVRPLHFAAQKGHLSVVDRLLEAKAEVEAEDKDSQRPLHVAAKNGHSDAVERLLSARADPEAQSSSGARPLHAAAGNGHSDAVERLLSARADPEAQNNVGWKPLHVAALNGSSDVVERLLAARADPEAQDQRGWRPLHWAASYGQSDVVERLLSARADPEAQNNVGWRPLHLAAENGQSDVVERLLAARADPEARNNVGERPLHQAAGFGSSDVVERLLAARADPEAQMNNGDTPWDGAKKRSHQKVMGLLRPVNIRLMSGNIIFCDPRPDRSVKDLREEVQRKLELEDAEQVQLIAQSGEKLRDEDTLGRAGVDYGTSLSAIVVPPEILHFPCGASFLIPSSVAKQELHPTADLVTDLTSIDVESLERQLEPKESLFHPIFQLSPEDTTFVDPIWVILPACVGSSKVWVSTHTGWKDVTKAASFGEGYAKVQLTHFCHMVTTGVPSCIKAMGFLSPAPVSKGKVSFVHIGCTFCMEALETQYMNDHDYLLGYSRCDNVAHLGTRPDSEEVEVSQQGVTRTISLNSSAFPILSNEWSAEASRFTLKIDHRDITFDHLGALSSAQATSPAPSSHAAYPTSNPSGSSPSQPDASTSAALPVVPPSAPRPAFTRRARDSAVPPAAQLMMQDRSRSPSTQAPQASSSTSGPGTISTAGRWRNRAPNSQAGSAPSSPSSPAPSLSPPVQVRPGPGARVAMFSARFDGGATEQRFRRIHEILAQSGYDILMVGVHPGETFGVPTTRYLGRIKRERGILLCVCTEHYGEMTSSDFSSFEELKFAKVYESFITIIPLRIGDYPPRPPIRGPNWPTHPDVHGDAQSYVDWVFNPARLYLDCQDQSGQDKSDIVVASAIADCLHR